VPKGYRTTVKDLRRATCVILQRCTLYWKSIRMASYLNTWIRPQLTTGEVLSPTRLKKTIERSALFVRRGGHCCCGYLVGRTTFWFFFEWFANVRICSL